MKLPSIAETYNASTFPVPNGFPAREMVPDDYRAWNIDFPGYQPPTYNAPVLYTHDALSTWSDTEGITSQEVNDRMFPDDISILGADGFPLNPHGRTGLRGRGLLGKRGPNYLGILILLTPELDRVLVLKRSDKFYGLPGGYREQSDRTIIDTATRETIEEAAPDYQPSMWIRQLGRLIMLPDPKTTDDAWIMAGFVVDVVNPQDITLRPDLTETESATFMDIEDAKGCIFPAHLYGLTIAVA